MKIRNILINLLLSIIAGILLLMCVYLIPTKNMDINVGKSASIMQEEGMHYRVFDWCSSILDNFTDSLMMLEVADNTDNTLLVKALKANRGDYYSTIDGPTETIVRHYFNGEEYELVNSYCRYWHGYLIFLKPLFYFFTYDTIRIINLVVQSILIISILYLMFKKNYKELIIPYVICYLMMAPYVITLSFQYSSCFYIYNIAILLLLILSSDFIKNYDYLVFLNIGIALAYFDFLTYPIVTLAIPLSFYLIKRDDLNGKKKLIRFIEMSICWGVGYFIMWAGKWVLATLFTDEEIIADAIKAILNRSSSVGGDGVTYNLIDCVYKNYSMFLSTPFKWILFAYSLYLVIKYVRYVYKNKVKVFNLELLSFVIMMFLPIIWFACTLNHSMIHSYMFVNKTCVVTFIVAMFYLASFTSRKNI